MMDRLFEICDEMASQGDFVKFRDIMGRYYGREITKLDGDTEYERLRRRLSPDRCHDVVEYQNGSDFTCTDTSETYNVYQYTREWYLDGVLQSGTSETIEFNLNDKNRHQITLK